MRKIEVIAFNLYDVFIIDHFVNYLLELNGRRAMFILLISGADQLLLVQLVEVEINEVKKLIEHSLSHIGLGTNSIEDIKQNLSKFL